eukprot:CAMPEP_0182875196 /NCGR_PEP_ID=MMETSP0034_2-20130328/13397_1 /TAXON_ID=156128 /ORGANISM="Nephroselmis pyriformis, Strain CCMP717" /LENGTH=145 /DNA_ID=CAMNT_0025007929 /DNA_START=327 /DNA_END=760 /DNA_ORIENTATION=+
MGDRRELEGSDDIVLKRMMKDGSFDHLRTQVIDSIKSSGEFQGYVKDLVENSRTLTRKNAEKNPKKQLMNDLRKELENKVLDKSSRVAWGVLLGDNIEKQLAETIRSVLDGMAEERGAEAEKEAGSSDGKEAGGAEEPPPAAEEP